MVTYDDLVQALIDEGFDEPTAKRMAEFEMHGDDFRSSEAKKLTLSYSDRSARVIDLAMQTLDRSPRKNWVEKAGGLDPYVRRIAIHLHEQGKSISTAIQMAWGIVRRWGSSGRTKAWGKDAQVTAKTRAKAAAASANMEAKRARAKSMSNGQPRVVVDLAHDLVFYSERSTPQVVAKGAEAKPKKGYGKVTKRRAATAEEERRIGKGEWVRVDQSGNGPSSDNYKKTRYRPQLVKTSKEFDKSEWHDAHPGQTCSRWQHADGNRPKAVACRKSGKSHLGACAQHKREMTKDVKLASDASISRTLKDQAAKAPAKKSTPKKKTQKQRRAENKSQRAQNWNEGNHKRQPSGSPAGGEFAPGGSKEEKDRANKSMADKRDPKTFNDKDLQDAARQVYGFKSSNPDVVKRRIQIANALAKRGMDVKKYGAKGGGITEKKSATKNRKVKASREVVDRLDIMLGNRKENTVGTVVQLSSTGRTVDLSGLGVIDLASRREYAKNRIRKATAKARGEFKRGDGQNKVSAIKGLRKSQGDGAGIAKGNHPGPPHKTGTSAKSSYGPPTNVHGNTARTAPHAGTNSDMPIGPGNKGRGRRKLSDPTKSHMKMPFNLSNEDIRAQFAMELGVPASVLKSKSPKTPNSQDEASDGPIPDKIKGKSKKKSGKRGGGAGREELLARLRKATKS